MRATESDPSNKSLGYSRSSATRTQCLFSYNADMNVDLKGLSREQITNLLPEGLISLCWRGSVAHGMYVPKSDPDSIDDKDVMGVYIAPIEHYLGFGRQDVYEKWEGEWDCGVSRTACGLERASTRRTSCAAFRLSESTFPTGLVRSSAPRTHLQARLHSQSTAENRHSPKVWRNQTAGPASSPPGPCECY
jgi:hypothetical protein